MRVAVISREDTPQLTANRLRHLTLGREASDEVIEAIRANLYLNSRKQTAQLMLDNEEQMAELTEALKARKIEFAIFDVLNVLHGSDENDAQQMTAVMRRLSRLREHVGCAIGVVHHFNKQDSGSFTKRLRGSGAIYGWAEWLVAITKADEETQTRRMDFELKAACPPKPIHYRIETAADWARLTRVDAPVEQANSRPRSSELLNRHRSVQ